uniref:CD109 antigen n=1 Tax=Oryzias sinensis TaxID=183150 RepID=A0A8C8E393_9TELE
MSFPQLQISRYDKRPLGLEELLNSAVVEVTQTDSSRNAKNTTLMLPVAENGTAKAQFKLQEHIAALFITAKFRSSQQSLTLYNNYSSPSGSYVQISHDSATPAQIGSPLQLNVESTFKLGSLQYVVSSKGQVVAAGTKNSSSFSLTPDLSWSPQACITVYCLLSDGELISDSVFIPIQKHNLVTLNWSKDKAQPGEQVSLTVAAAESKVQVGIVVMGADSSMLQSAPDFMLEQIYNLKTMTNVRVNKNMLPRNENDLFNNLDNDLTVEKYWRYWMDGTDSVAWFDTFVSDKSWTSEKITVPDGVTFLGAVVLVMSENLGLGFTPVPQKLSVSKDFSLSLVAPPHIIRGEEIVLEANIFNYLEHNLEVIVLLAQSEAFKFVLSNQRDMSVINAKQLTIGSHASASALFPIEPLVLGEMEISVEAVSMEASDSVVWKLLVKPEGIEQSSSQTLFLELAPQSDSYSRSISFSFPPHVVPGSQMARVALGGDILALSINNLDSLVQIPIGCGEQNMIHLAPSLYVLQYLDKSGQDDAEIRSRALGYLTKGYKTQLSYRRDDGSFSAFGESDASGSTWLTAFVLRCFLQAQTYIQVDQEVLIQALMWLLKHQGQQGEFLEVGRLIHTEMQGGMDDSSVALTAFVLVAFLEDDSYKEKYASNVSLALNYLENKLSSGVVSNYSLSLVAYALARGNRPLASRALTELKNRADNIGGVMMWTSSAGLNSHDLSRVQSAQIEMAAYVLLALFVRGSFIEGIELMKWLSIQTNHLGGFGTTQDTVIALQALAYYAAFSGANAINLKIDMSSSTSSFKMSFNINSTNYRMCQNQKINAEKDLPLNMYIQGQGFALVQLNTFYNVENQTFLQSPQQASDEEAFSLNIHLAEASNHSNMILTICTRLKDNQKIPNTGMVIVDVGMLSGLGLLPEATLPSDLVRKVESTPEKVHLYLDSVRISCFFMM